MVLISENINYHTMYHIRHHNVLYYKYVSLIHDIMFVSYCYDTSNIGSTILGYHQGTFQSQGKMWKQNKKIMGLEKHFIYIPNHFTLMKA